MVDTECFSRPGTVLAFHVCLSVCFRIRVCLSGQVFGNLIPVSFYDQICTDVFGAGFNATTIANNVAWTNGVYGGVDIEGSDIVFPNGRLVFIPDGCCFLCFFVSFSFRACLYACLIVIGWLLVITKMTMPVFFRHSALLFTRVVTL